MSALAFRHPVNLVLGAVLVAEEMATKGRQMTFASFCSDAVDWAVETRDLLREIACDAAHGFAVVGAVASDGIITPAEANQLKEVFSEIETEALTGEIK